MMSANLTKQPIARTLPSPAVTASEAPYLVSPHPLPLIHITSPEGHVQEIFPPARRTAVRYNPDAIGRLQAARFADTPPAGAALPAAQEQEAPVAELPSSSLISVIRAAIVRLFKPKKPKDRRAKPQKRRAVQRQRQRQPEQL